MDVVTHVVGHHRRQQCLGVGVAGVGQRIDRRPHDGDPAEVRLDLSREADLLVLGSSHLGTVSGAVLGSVAQRCIAEAAVSVVVVPDTDRA